METPVEAEAVESPVTCQHCGWPREKHQPDGRCFDGSAVFEPQPTAEPDPEPEPG